MKQYSHAAVAGTFDRLHRGQKQLLIRALKETSRLSIGIATIDLLSGKLLSRTIQDYEIRKKRVRDYINSQRVDCKVDYFPLSDIYGIARHDTTLEALFVTPATYANAEKVNQFRMQKSLSRLDIVSVPLVKSTDGGVISSGRIRLGEINRNGFAYRDIFKGKTKLVMPEKLRSTLRKPLGKVIGHPEKLKETIDNVVNSLKKLQPLLTIAVGDIISQTLIDAGWIPDIKIIDFKSRREIIDKAAIISMADEKKIVNQPGTVSAVAAERFKELIDAVVKNPTKATLVVDGEEDLTALPAILLAPLGAVVLYGHFNLGVILVEVTEEKKEEIRKILEMFNHD